MFRLRFLLTFCLLILGTNAFSNVPGGGTGTGPNVTLVDNGNGTVTMANGIVSIVITKADATIHQINYTYNNSGSPTTYQVLSGGNSGGQMYWEFGGFSAGSATYSVVANTPDYAEVDLLFTSASSGSVDIHFSMLRGSTGFYATPIWSHDIGDIAMGMGETRDNIYISPTFTWNSIDAAHNFQYNVGGSAVGVGGQGAPVEVSLWTSGIAAGHYEDKYKYSADFGTERVWGWSSINNPAAGFTGRNIGIWHVLASAEYYNGGPMKPELMDAPMVNMLNGGHYQMGSDSQWGANEVWTRVSGPYFIYLNSITNTITNPSQAANALFADAQAQAVAEATAWPYSWFNNPNYVPAAQRGTVSGKIVINDSGNPNASASNLWVGVVRQPITVSGVYDFQQWMKPYQFWVQSDADGNFTIPNVIATNNYTLYAFGPGANGTFMSQNQTGGNPPLLFNLPAAPFSVTVTGGATNDLGTVTWTSSRVGPTVFEIGYPDRTSKKFRHGDDWWVGDIGPNATNPMPVWSKFLEFPFDFPSGPNYVVGQSRWSTDWNFVQPVVVDAAGNMNASSSTITFNLAGAPAGGATASLYIGTASDDAGPLIININGTVLVSGSGGVTASPSSLPSTGYFPQYSSSDTTIRDGVSAVFSDERINFPATLLHANQNTITLNMRKGGSLNNHAMYDYLRLELTGYVPPPPGSVAAYPGNNCNLIAWPVTPGATSYNILRSTTSGSGFVSITNGVVGPVCGSGYNNACFVDSTAANGVTYYYAVQSANPTGTSTNSPESVGITPDAAISTSAPPAPTSVVVGSVAHHSVTLNWSPAPGANFYTVYRSTLVDTLGGSSNTLSTIALNNNTTSATYTDVSPTDGTIYRYFVTATGPGGTSGSNAVVAIALPAPPATAPSALNGHFVTSSVVLNWSAVSGAVGYIIRRSTSSAGPFSYVMNITKTTYTDTALDPSVTYYYRVTAVNAAGISTPATVTVIPAPLAPASLSAIPGDSKVTLSWTSVPGATGYYLYVGTSSGDETNLVVGNYPGTSYTNTSLINGTTYYYVVTSTNLNGESPDSPEANATPNVNIVITPRSLTWRGDGSANIWDVSGADNFQTNNVTTIFNNGDSVTFDNSGSNNVPVSVAGTPQPALVLFNATKNYTLGGVGFISGTNKLVKTGTGTLTINSTNLYSGGTIISNSTVLPGNIGANGAAWGSGPITLYGGIIQFNGYGGSVNTGWGGLTNTIIVPAGQTGTLRLPPRWGYSAPFTSPLTGGGTLNVINDYVRDSFSGNWSAFTGVINVTPRSGTGDFRIDNSAGYANAALILNNGVSMYPINGNGQTIDIGELGGGTTAFIGAGGSINPTWRIGARNTTNTYPGTLADAGVTSLIKTGTGMLVLSGANTYSGTTTVNGGTLKVINIAGTATGYGAVTVANGGTLAGNGIVGGSVTINSGGALAPGNPLGTLLLSNNLTLASGSTTFVQVQHSPLTNDSVKVLGALTEGGALNVTNSGAAALTSGDTFTLFNAANYSGSFTTSVLPQLSGNLVWNTNALKTSGTLSVMALTQPTIASINMVGGNLIVSGSGGPNGWPYYLLASTNFTLPTAQWTRVATNQFDGSGNFSVTNAVDSSASQKFYQIQLQ